MIKIYPKIIERRLTEMAVETVFENLINCFEKFLDFQLEQDN